jgi:hypothetical protein
MNDFRAGLSRVSRVRREAIEMKAYWSSVRSRSSGKWLGIAGVLFFLVKGLVWVGLAVGGYSALTN